MLLLPDSFIPGFTPPPDAAGAAATRWFVFCGQQLLVLRYDDDDAAVAAVDVPTGDWPLADAEPLRQVYMGRWGERHCIAAEVAEDIAPPPRGDYRGLRQLWGGCDAALVGLAGQGLQLIDWDRTHQYCGRCGGPTARRDSERSRHCENCGQNHYPRVAPAMMVRIHRDDRILLARAPRFPPDMYSVLAGFVDPGETLEQTVHREVMEEVGLAIDKVRYLCSQSWPFPHSLMIAFRADYAGGDIVCADPEIADADWFHRDAMPQIPPTMSIARRLIDGYLRGDDRAGLSGRRT